MKRYKLTPVLLTLLFAFLLVGCAAQKPTDGAKEEKTSAVGMANPVVTYDSLAEAEKAAGFKFTVPEGVNFGGADYAQYYWSTINKDLIEVRYGSGGDEIAYMRKAPVSASKESDISGDYNVYDDTDIKDVGLEDGRTATVMLKGKEGKYYVALWQLKGAKDNGVWNYAIGVRGMAEDELLELVKMVE